MTAATIFAVSTARGKAGIAVVRISGPEAGAALRALKGNNRMPWPRFARPMTLKDPGSGEVLDEALVLWFPGPASVTGEDVVELHLHGGRAVIEGMLGALGRISGLRLAEPGEFTRRAFDNGKLDLTAVEGLGDLIAAETPVQRRLALRQLSGALADLYDRWRQQLIQLMALLEATIDFSDEADVPPEVAVDLKTTVDVLCREIAAHLNDGRRGERLRDGIHIALLGRPNAGKSSLLNCLAQRDAAIVAPTPGTTRDILEVHLDLSGYPVVLIDTAGLRDSTEAGLDPVEVEGMRRAKAAAETADLRVVLIEGSDSSPADNDLQTWIAAADLIIRSKCDLGLVPRLDRTADDGMLETLPISVVTQEGISALIAKLTGLVHHSFGARDIETAPVLTRARHREALEETLAALKRVTLAPLPDLAAEDLRLAARALGRITGRVDVEDLLDEIFMRFCIGK